MNATHDTPADGVPVLRLERASGPPPSWSARKFRTLQGAIVIVLFAAGFVTLQPGLIGGLVLLAACGAFVRMLRRIWWGKTGEATSVEVGPDGFLAGRVQRPPLFLAWDHAVGAHVSMHRLEVFDGRGRKIFVDPSRYEDAAYRTFVADFVVMLHGMGFGSEGESYERTLPSQGPEIGESGG